MAARARTAIGSGTGARRAWASQPAPVPTIKRHQSGSRELAPAAGPLLQAVAQPGGGRRFDRAVVEPEDQLVLRPPAGQTSAGLGILGQPAFDRGDALGGQMAVGIGVKLRLVGRTGPGSHLILLSSGSALAGSLTLQDLPQMGPLRERAAT